MSNENGLPRLQSSGDEGEAEVRRVELTSVMMYDICAVIYGFTERGAAFSLYRSRDGSALAIRIKSGKETKAYWIGPDDNHGDVLDRIVRDWGVNCETDILFPEVRRVAAEIDAETP